MQIPGQSVPGGLSLGDLKGAWAVTLRALLKNNPDLSAKEQEDRRVAFYMGACTYQSMLLSASRLPAPYPEQVINAMDTECDTFRAQMHKLAQQAIEEARRKERGEIEPAPGGSAAT